MSSLFPRRPVVTGLRLLLIAVAVAACAGWYFSPRAATPASQTPLPVEACQETVTLSDGTEELLAVPGCAAHHRQQAHNR